MKHITLIIGLQVQGCGKQEQADTNESTPTTNTNKVSGPRVQPDGDVDLLVKELTAEEKEVVGTYEREGGRGGWKLVLLNTGVFEVYSNGKIEEEYQWKITKEGEIHFDDFEDKDGKIYVFRKNKDKSITIIGGWKDGKRIDLPKEDQPTLKRTK